MKSKSIVLAIMYLLFTFFLPIVYVILSLKTGFDVVWLVISMLLGSAFVWLTFAKVLKKRKAICVNLMAFLVMLAAPIASFILTFCFSNSILVLFNVEELFSIGEAITVLFLDIFLWLQVIVSQILLLIFNGKRDKEKTENGGVS